MEKKVDLKEMSAKQRIGYIWDYYKWHIIGSVLAVCIVGSVLHHFITYRNPLLNVIMINADSSSVQPDSFREFQEVYGYDLTDSPVSASTFYFPDGDSAFASSYMDYQALTAIIAAGNQDIFLGNGDTYLNYCDQGALMNLSDVLSPAQMEKYADSLIYSTVGGTQEPYPCAIDLSGHPWLAQFGYTDTCYFGILSCYQNPDACTQFAEFLLTYE